VFSGGGVPTEPTPALNCALVLMSGWTGVDFSTYGPDEEVRYSRQDAQTSALETLHHCRLRQV
jgi:hypothetical protein